ILVSDWSSDVCSSDLDFYLYAFERDRIFARLRSFEGRNAIQLRTFLAYYVLRVLFLDWQRGRHELDTVSLDDKPGADGSRPLARSEERRVGKGGRSRG